MDLRIFYRFTVIRADRANIKWLDELVHEYLFNPAVADDT
jgi:hypothetical protein